MTNCCSNTQYLLKAAEACLSPVAEERWEMELFKIAPNPFPEGRARETARRREARLQRVSGLVWC